MVTMTVRLIDRRRQLRCMAASRSLKDHHKASEEDMATHRLIRSDRMDGQA